MIFIILLDLNIRYGTLRQYIYYIFYPAVILYSGMNSIL